MKWPLSCDNMLYGTISLNSASANSAVRFQFAETVLVQSKQLDGELSNDIIALRIQTVLATTFTPIILH